jgi:hypothetical protein
VGKDDRARQRRKAEKAKRKANRDAKAAKKKRAESGKSESGRATRQSHDEGASRCPVCYRALRIATPKDLSPERRRGFLVEVATILTSQMDDLTFEVHPNGTSISRFFSDGDEVEEDTVDVSIKVCDACGAFSWNIEDDPTKRRMNGWELTLALQEYAEKAADEVGHPRGEIRVEHTNQSFAAPEATVDFLWEVVDESIARAARSRLEAIVASDGRMTIIEFGEGDMTIGMVVEAKPPPS